MARASASFKRATGASCEAVNFRTLRPGPAAGVDDTGSRTQSNAAPGAAEFRFPFTPESFREDSRIDDIASWSLVDDDGALAAFGPMLCPPRALPFRPPRGVAVGCAAAGSARGSSANSRAWGLAEFGDRELSLFVNMSNEVRTSAVPAARLSRSALPRWNDALHGKLALHGRNRTEARPMTRWQLAIPLTLALAAAACVQKAPQQPEPEPFVGALAFVPPVRERRIRRDQGSRIHVRIQRGRGR